MTRFVRDSANAASKAVRLSCLCLGFCILFVLFGTSARAGIDVPWSTTYDCPDWNQYSDPLDCDNISKKGSWTASPGDYYEQITIDANYPGGAGGKGQRHWVGDTSNNNSGSVQINFNTPQSRFWMRWYQRWQEGFTSNWDTFKNVWFEADTGNRMVFHTGRPGIGGIDLYPPDETTEVSNVAWGVAFYSSGVSDGSWHAFEVFLDIPNRIWRCWIDGNLVAEHTNVDYAGATAIDYIILPENMKNTANGAVMYIDFDDVTITNSGPIGLIDNGEDTIAPTTSITSPSDGASAVGTIDVTASASDNVGVAGVQFLLDGANLGAELTAAPYEITLDTTTLTDGTHTLAARARDAAGNQTTSAPVTIDVQNDSPPPSGVLFSEPFEDADLTSRGWYDNTSGQVLDSTEYAPVNGSTSSAQYHFAAGATVPDSGAAIRHKFTATDSLYFEYWVKYSAGFQGSGVASHPHEFFFLSDQDSDWSSPNYTSLQMKVEQSALRPRVIFRDDQIVNTSFGTPPIDLVSDTEARSVCGCNGEQDGYSTICYESGGRWYNGKHFLHDAAVITDGAWHEVAVYVKLNSVTASTTNADGIMKYWLDGNLILDYSNIVMRTSDRPTIKFNQIGIAPYIGVGSPIDQTFWVDELLVGTEMPTTDTISAPRNLRIVQ